MIERERKRTGRERERGQRKSREKEAGQERRE